MDEKKPLLSHFLALRKVFLISVIAVIVGFIAAFYFFSTRLIDFITLPIKERGVEIIYTAVSEAMTTRLKISLVTGIILASPVIIWQIWNFVKPALYEKEIRALRFWFFVTLLLFLIGVVFCYYFVFGLAVNFFLVAGDNLAAPLISIDRYLSFTLSFILPFGFAFDLPVIIYMTTKLGLTTPEMLIGKSKYVVLLFFIVAAILTPPDVYSQIMLAIPLLLLYGVGILAAFTVKKRENGESKKQQKKAASNKHRRSAS